jgi:hypothetical protein
MPVNSVAVGKVQAIEPTPMIPMGVPTVEHDRTPIAAFSFPSVGNGSLWKKIVERRTQSLNNLGAGSDAALNERRSVVCNLETCRVM